MTKLREEALQKDISINTLVSQTLRQHTDWQSHAPRAGFVVTRRSFLQQLMEKLSDQDISSISNKVSTKETKDFVLLLRNEYNVYSFLSVLESWIRASGYPFRHENTDNVHSYVIRHDMGKKMSLSLAEIYRTVFEEFNLRPAHFDLTNNTLSFIVDTSAQ